MRQELTSQDRNEIRQAIVRTVERIAFRRSICVEAVANEAFYQLQRNKKWGRNATQTEKRASLKWWKGMCYYKDGKVRFENAVFHHLKRGVPRQHGPKNLVPMHSRCHNRDHGAKKGSLLKGGPRKRRP